MRKTERGGQRTRGTRRQAVQLGILEFASTSLVNNVQSSFNGKKVQANVCGGSSDCPHEKPIVSNREYA